MKLLFFLTLITSLNLYSSEKIHKYTVEISDLNFKDWEFDNYDAGSMLLANTLRGIKEGTESCIDLRSKGSAGNYSGDDVLISRDTIEMISNKDISVDLLQSEIIKTCNETFNQHKEDKTNCSFVVSKKSIELNQSYLGFYSYEDKSHRATKATISKVSTKIPMMSYACITGKHRDSWNDSAPTKIAKTFLSESKINLTDIKNTYMLVWKNPTNNKYYKVWGFGFIDHSEKK